MVRRRARRRQLLSENALDAQQHCIAQRLLTSPQPLRGLMPIHPAESTWSITLIPLPLKTSTHLSLCPVAVTWKKPIPANPTICLLGPYHKVSKQVHKKHPTMAWTSVYGPQPQLALPGYLLPHFQGQLIKKAVYLLLIYHHSSFIPHPTETGFHLSILRAFTEVPKHLHSIWSKGPLSFLVSLNLHPSPYCFTLDSSS